MTGGSYQEPENSPYDSTVEDFDPGTPPIEKALADAIDYRLLSVRVCLPCAVTKVRGEQLVDVQPLLQARYLDGQVVNIPPIPMVPVSMKGGKLYSDKDPLSVGDTGYCVFADRSLAAWLAGQGQIVDPQDSRQHHITDAIFVPGLVPTALQTQDGTTDRVLRAGLAVLRMQQDGHFLIGNGTLTLGEVLGDSSGLVKALEDFCTTCAGSSDPTLVSAANALQLALNAPITGVAARLAKLLA